MAGSWQLWWGAEEWLRGGAGGDFLEQFFGYGRFCDHAATSSSTLTERCPDSVHRQSSCLLLCNRDVYPQCKLCSRPSKFPRCRSWAGS